MTTETRLPSAWYASSRSGFRQWWTVLHPPYTLWHLSYVVLGASVAADLDVVRLIATLLAFALAVGLSAHALDELNGRPLQTDLPSAALIGVAVTTLAAAVTLGILGVGRVGPGLLAFVVVGVALVVGYNLELGGGVLHNDATFALAWGGFPTLVGYFAQTGRVSPAAVLVATAACGLSLAQRTLSTPARRLRRRVTDVRGVLTLREGSVELVDRAGLLAPLETALRILSWTTVLLAAGLATSHYL